MQITLEVDGWLGWAYDLTIVQFVKSASKILKFEFDMKRVNQAGSKIRKCIFWFEIYSETYCPAPQIYAGLVSKLEHEFGLNLIWSIFPDAPTRGQVDFKIRVWIWYEMHILALYIGQGDFKIQMIQSNIRFDMGWSIFTWHALGQAGFEIWTFCEVYLPGDSIY